MSDEGAGAIDFTAVRRCIYCSRRKATPDALSCIECMRGESMEDIHRRLGVLMANVRKVTIWDVTVPLPRPTLWARLKRWLRAAAPSQAKEK